jgi:cytochrome c oxidase cbb3-type subunit 1
MRNLKDPSQIDPTSISINSGQARDGASQRRAVLSRVTGYEGWQFHERALLMNTSVMLLLASFVLSLVGLFVFIASMTRGLFGTAEEGSRVIFSVDEENTTEDPAATRTDQALLQAEVRRGSAARAATGMGADDLEARIRGDRSSAGPVLLCLTSAVIWLLCGSLAGLISSIKMHMPDWLVGEAWLTFGRIRPAHLNMVIYGWSSLAGVGIALWLMPRLLRTELVGGRFASVGAIVWNVGVAGGIASILLGHSTGLEWLEFPFPPACLLLVGGALMGVPLILTLRRRQVKHLYVSVWYLGAALLWFPVLYAVANAPGVHFGVEQATMNWWFGHNVLGLWFTPLGLAAAYYLIPKVLGTPIYSYNLSLLGFWTLAFFYSQVGGHHLIGGPVPTWLITLSIVQSIMMVVPVFAVAVNQHMTVFRHFSALRYSPTLRFIVLGAMMYTLVSIQGSIEALRSVNTITHFTHFTIAHAHLGLYGFFAMVMFGSTYFVMPRVLGREWPHSWMISLHFWLVITGFAIYFVALTVGGWLQGLAMLDAKQPFMASVAVTLPYLQARSLGGALMVFGHFVFAAHFLLMISARKVTETGPTYFGFVQPVHTLASRISS